MAPGLTRRLELQAILEAIRGSDNVYFQPPPTVQLQFPCIVYKRDFGDTKFADNKPYSFKQRYEITVINRDSDDPAIDLIRAMPMTVFLRHFVRDGLNHDVFQTYF